MADSEPLLYLSGSTLEELAVTIGEVVAIIEHLIRGNARSRVWNAPKATVLPEDGRYLMATLRQPTIRRLWRSSPLY